MTDALLDPIGRNCERKPARKRRTAWQVELTQPGARRQPGEPVEHDLQDVPAPDETESRRQRPEQEAERPAGVVRLRLHLGPEGVGIPPGSPAVLELVSDEPVVVQRLQMVSGGRFAVRGSTAGEEVRAGVQDCRPRGRDPCAQVERNAERYIACAARSSSSKSGTSAVS